MPCRSTFIIAIFGFLCHLQGNLALTHHVGMLPPKRSSGPMVRIKHWLSHRLAADQLNTNINHVPHGNPGDISRHSITADDSCWGIEGIDYYQVPIGTYWRYSRDLAKYNDPQVQDEFKDCERRRLAKPNTRFRPGHIPHDRSDIAGDECWGKISSDYYKDDFGTKWRYLKDVNQAGVYTYEEAFIECETKRLQNPPMPQDVNPDDTNIRNNYNPGTTSSEVVIADVNPNNYVQDTSKTETLNNGGSVKMNTLRNGANLQTDAVTTGANTSPGHKNGGHACTHSR